MEASELGGPSRAEQRWRATAVGVGAAIVVLFAVLPAATAAFAMFVATSAVAAGVCLAAARRKGLAAPRAWLGAGAALAMLAAGNAITLTVRLTGRNDLQMSANLLFFLAYVPLFAATYRFGRGARRLDRTAILDTAIVGLSAMPLVWELVVEAHLSKVDGTTAMAAVALPVIDIMLVSLAAPLLVRRTRSASAFLFFGGLMAMAAGDSIFAIGTLDGGWTAPLALNVLWLASYVLIALAAIVPSARVFGTLRDPRPGASGSTRILVVSAGIVVAPLATLETALFARADEELTAFAVLSLAVAALVVVRLQRTIAQLDASSRRFQRFMDHEGILAMIKDRSGRYLYRNATAEQGIRGEHAGWYGRTDAELFPPSIAAQRAQADSIVRETNAALTETFTDGTHVWHTERFAIPGQRGEVGVLGVDITDRMRAEKEVRFQAHLLESVRDAVVVVDVDGRFTYWNQGAQDIFGFAREDMLGKGMLEAVAPSSVPAVQAMWGAALNGNGELGDVSFVRADGSPIWLNTRVSPITDLDAAPAGFLAIVKDVTEVKRGERELRRLDAAIAHATDAIIVTEGNDQVTYVNPAFERMSGIPASQLIGSTATDPAFGHGFANALEQARRGGGTWRGDLVDRRRDGTDLVAETSISPVGSISDPAGGFVTIKRDVTHERAAERAAERRTRERALIAETLGALRAGDSAEATASAVCAQTLKVPELCLTTLVVFGADGTANVLGQAVRDGEGTVGRSLTALRSGYLRSRAAGGPWVERWVADPANPYDKLLRDSGIVAHAYAPLVAGGQPIGVLIAGTNQADGVERLTERLPALVEFASIATTLLADAVSERNDSAASRARMRDVIDQGSFRIVYQPIVDLATGDELGFEALTRFDDDTPPDVMFQRAIDLGLGLELEAACLARAFEGAARLPETAWIDVNTSPETVLSGVLESVLPAGCARPVVIEITEHHAISDYAAFRAAVAPMRDRVRIAVDDAGAGFASLRHIVELAPAMVKLDRSLVAGIPDDQARQAVVAGMVRFAQTAGLVLIAEGIETPAERELLGSLGIPLGQGYLLGLPAEAPAGATGSPSMLGARSASATASKGPAPQLGVGAARSRVRARDRRESVSSPVA